MDQQRAQVHIALPVDAPEHRLAAGGELPRHQPQPGGKLPTIPEQLRIAHAGHHRAGGDRSHAAHGHDALHGRAVTHLGADAPVVGQDVLVEHAAAGVDLVQHLALDALDRNEAHVGSGRRLADGFSVVTVVLLIAPVTDRSMMDTQDGTYVWEYSQEDCPDSIVQLYLGDIKVLSNSSSFSRFCFKKWLWIRKTAIRNGSEN